MISRAVVSKYLSRLEERLGARLLQQRLHALEGLQQLHLLGLAERLVMRRHVLRNAWLPTLTILGLPSTLQQTPYA